MQGYIEQARFHDTSGEGQRWPAETSTEESIQRVTEVKSDAVNSGGFVTASTINGDPLHEPSNVKPVGRGSGGLDPGEVRST